MNQVIIVGAGPAGATLALLLVKQGISVTLIEASRDFRRLFRGEALMPSGLTALEQMGLSDALAKIPHKSLDRWEFLLNRRSLFQVDEPFEVGGKSCTLVSQPHLLSTLIDIADNYPNFKFISGEPVRDSIKNNEGRVIGVKLGNKTVIKADLVIGTDGRNSLLRSKANLSLQQLSNNIDILWFKFDANSLLESVNTFYSILQDGNGFGLFRGSLGQLQIGWGLHRDENLDWKQVDWKEILIANSPDWLAKHLQQPNLIIPQPILLSTIVGRCDRWSIPGLLLLGDAVHPMSPIRAQGINMALRDTIVAANHLIPLLKTSASPQEIDRVLPLIQQEREPEISRIQELQSQELAQAEILHHYPLLRSLLKQFIPLISPLIRYSWLTRQRKLRQGVTKVSLKSEINY
jgi:2-polyprenyl-6-methoxyphenol hydroxylase-like FAD-dependent oxidoreductase